MAPVLRVWVPLKQGVDSRTPKASIKACRLEVEQRWMTIVLGVFFLLASQSRRI